MSGQRSLKILAAVAFSFTALVATVLGLLVAGVINFPQAMLMCVALVGLYVGFGVLILVGRFISSLE